MHEHVTILRPDTHARDSRRISAVLPADLLEQVRSRVQLLALIVFAAAAFEPAVYFSYMVANRFVDLDGPSRFREALGFQLANVGAAAASAALWWVARNRKVSATRLHTLGLAYEIAICFVVAILNFWTFYDQKGMLPPLTWVPAIIVLFPLILPGPPGRTFAAAIASAAMCPLALLVLDLLGKVRTDADAYIQAVVSCTFAVGFAYMGARIVYGLGREVAAAREMGSYRLEERLGQGGMGEVWRARHHMLARPAAIKLIRPTLGEVSQEAVRRFEREAQVIARLHSPHTVQLFDFGVAENGAFYYVMELLEGLDADALVRRFGPVPAERVVHLLLQVCHSLSEAESCGVVHRDIKPANIFLCRYGQDVDFVKVLDFGLVKATNDQGDTRLPLTADHVIQGTPAFIAPEQALGQADLDNRVDIYATGCVAYWLLTGQPVFSADTPMKLLMNHVYTPATPPSKRTDMPISATLDGLVLSCLAKDRAERPQSARDLARRLAEVESAGRWTEDRARDWWTKHQPVSA